MICVAIKLISTQSLLLVLFSSAVSEQSHRTSLLMIGRFPEYRIAFEKIGQEVFVQMSEHRFDVKGFLDGKVLEGFGQFLFEEIPDILDACQVHLFEELIEYLASDVMGVVECGVFAPEGLGVLMLEDFAEEGGVGEEGVGDEAEGNEAEHVSLERIPLLPFTLHAEATTQLTQLSLDIERRHDLLTHPNTMLPPLPLKKLTHHLPNRISTPLTYIALLLFRG